MKKIFFAFFAVTLFNSFILVAAPLNDDHHPSLAIGAKAPDFNLPGVDGKKYNLASFASAKLLVVVFTCNHCPTAQAYENRIIECDSLPQLSTFRCWLFEAIKSLNDEEVIKFLYF